MHIQISEMLVREIQAGVLLDGERLPPERRMAHSLGISVGTLRKALSDLAGKGMLERIHGSGNYVRNNGDVDSIYAFFRLELKQGGGLPTAETLTVDRLTKPNDIPPFGQSEAGFRIRRLRRLNGVDGAVEEVWLDGAYADSIEPTLLSDSLYQFYRQHLGCRIARVEDRVSLANPPPWMPADFGSHPRRDWGFVERLSHDQNNTVAEFSRTWFDTATVSFVSRWR